MKQSISISSMDLARLVTSALESLLLVLLNVHIMASGVTTLTTGPGVAMLVSLGLGLIMVMARTKLFTATSSPDMMTMFTFIVSAPCVVIQVILIKDTDFEAASLFWRWVQVFCLLASFVSLLLTSISFSQEPGPWPRRMLLYLLLTSASGARILLTSILLSVSLVTGLLFLLASLALHIGGHLALGDGGLSLFLGWANLFIPLGHSHGVCANSEKLPSMSEVERMKINEAGLLQRLKRFYLLFLFSHLALLSTTVAAESHYPGSRTYLPHLITVLLLIIALVTGLLYFLYIRRKVGASDDNEDLSAPASPSTPMRPEAGDTVTIEQERPEPDQERLYPALPSAPEPPYNPYFRPEAGDGGRELEIIGNTKCDNSGCVTCAKMVTGAVFRSSVTGREYGVRRRPGTETSCGARHLVYLVTCTVCSKQYVGKTEQTLRQRHYGHRREVEQASSALGQHFSEVKGECGGLDSLSLQVIEVVEGGALLAREGHWQHELSTFAPGGINIRDELGGARAK